MKKFSSKWRYTGFSELNVTPMLDFAFTLMIIFLITTPLLEQNLDISLPSLNSKKEPTFSRNPLVLEIHKNGKIVCDNIPVDKHNLEKILLERLQKDPELTVSLKMDKDLKYEEFLPFVEILEKAGIKRIGLVHNVDEKQTIR
ncbi:biopolymer transporter ExbD [Candidatus Methylacidiphilum fumarolicum]|uniref:Biopolymer transport protein n=2 Tax=Candidatus Methylacidiphilum fumarolicum TaxID=591154 RepID=I0K1A4_METFB|nr:biopolymer transporter ExbD [Candidatus Methylacidiphilum fumarolicum]MBW6414971.1 biopolymer transporter ExbD [Candidatus Methylacidiphilum fumarolicum]TFE70342.1 biopolymer transporter [Candidatus Methylacidiphilum fumarolicum]TFE73978.1 biopolymer transporter ExbD [Candidatus Methylacidiphilum fumarolicum]TFE74485.1 biopolymer transporter ExbD [Candidatus Methylacidiphilum fumarolicum]TFE77854.1 biopolymer transporter [Candidatus Methylacidiphilum fumarolicum]